MIGGAVVVLDVYSPTMDIPFQSIDWGAMPMADPPMQDPGILLGALSWLLSTDPLFFTVRDGLFWDIFQIFGGVFLSKLSS